jgi:hypothetical protein
MLIHNLVATGSAIVSGSSIITGNLTVLGSISGSAGNAISASYAQTASYAANSDLLDNRDSTTFANTGSNSFVGTQNINGAVAITGSLTTTGAITAQTLNVQQVTSSIIYSSGSNVFGNSLSNTQSMTGSVGITGSLAVTGAATFSGNIGVGGGTPSIFTAYSVASFGNLSTTTNGITIASTTTGNGIIEFADGVTSNQAYRGYIQYAHTTDSLIFATAGSDRLTITSGGNVEIRSAGQLIAYRSDNTRWGSFYTDGVAVHLTSSTDPMRISSADRTEFYTGGSERVRITSGGNVLIGTTTDGGYKFQVNGQSNLDGYNLASSFQFTRAASNLVTPASGNGILVFAGGNAQMRMDTANQICFDMNDGGTPHTVLTLKQNSNTVSINSPNNTLPLEIKYQNVAYGYYGATSGFSGAALAYSVNGGYVYLSSSSTWVGASDRNIKKNFEPYNKGLEAICGLEPTLYNLKIQQDSEPKLVGLIAQEVNNYIPEAYSEEGDFIGLNYNAIIVTMINAIQELNEKITQLENK